MAIGPLYRSFLELAYARDLPVDALLEGIGLSREQLAHPEARLSPEQGIALGRALREAVRDPEIGLAAAERARVGDFGVLGYILKHARDLADALTLFARYGRLIGDTAACTIEYGDDHVIVSLGRTGGRRLLPEADDFMVATFARMIRMHSGDRVQALEVRLVREEPPTTRAYARAFGVPVHFGAPISAVVYASSALDTPMAHADPELLRILVQRAEAELAALPPDSHIVARVRAHLARDLEAGNVELSEVARSLVMSERTLRRRLREAATGFRELSDEVRRERALALFERGEHSVTAIAMMTGFTDVAAFARAFRRWTGRSPSDYRAARSA